MKYKKIRTMLIEFVFLYGLIAFVSKYNILITLFIMIIPISIVFIIILNSRERSLNDKNEQDYLLNICSEKINVLRKHMDILYTLNKNYHLSKVDHFLNTLNKCNGIKDYQSLLTLINHEIMYISAVIEVLTKESYQNKQENNPSQERSSIRNKKIIAALLILELSPKTKDFAVIKKQYHSLMMKYHPDRNHNEEAKEIAISVNAAYKMLETEYSI